MRMATAVVGVLVLAGVIASAERAQAQCQAGIPVGGSCWFYAASFQSCTDACAAAGFPYDEATRTFAGSDGTDANCQLVLDAFQAPGGAVATNPNCSAGFGCATEPGPSRFRCTAPTDPDAAFAGRRACACQAQAVPQPTPTLTVAAIAVGLLALIVIAAWRLSTAKREAP